MTVSETLDGIKKYIAAKGFLYEDRLIENFYLCLKSKPFVLLAGTSGTGKTRLVRYFAEAVGANARNGRFKLVSVKPDWSSPSYLAGHVDITGSFIPGEITDFVAEAEKRPDDPYFLCLDEMNLARVEYYLGDYLSASETRTRQNGRITSDVFIGKNVFGKDAAAYEKYGDIRLPGNLYLIGTVNMDETTFPFSRKVLDRANTIEFSHIKLNELPPLYPGEPAVQTVQNDFLSCSYLSLYECLADDPGYADFIQSVCDKLEVINGILLKSDDRIGYRVRDEIVFYMINNKKYSLIPDSTAFDLALMQKILPGIEGSTNSTLNTLCELFRFLCGDYSGAVGASDSEQMANFLEHTSKGRYPKTAEKLVFMTRRFEEDGFTSYWLS